MSEQKYRLRWRVYVSSTPTEVVHGLYKHAFGDLVNLMAAIKLVGQNIDIWIVPD